MTPNTLIMKDIQIDFQMHYGTGIAVVHPVCPLTTVRNKTDGNVVRKWGWGNTSHPSMIC
jgi:hypothetical protein